MIVGLCLVFATFCLLAVLTGRSQLSKRSTREWIFDCTSLLVQGLLIPVAQTLLLATLWKTLWPSLNGSFSLSPAVAFLLNFVLIDYLYYWNHRLLHTSFFWRWHRMHHSVENLDFFATSRNSLFTPALIVYVWANSLFVFVLGDAKWFLIASSVSAALDLWRHSGFRVQGHVFSLLSPWLILPQDHAQHHSREENAGNFGANLKIWDKCHGTYLESSNLPSEFGIEDKNTLTWSEFFWPTGMDKTE